MVLTEEMKETFLTEMYEEAGLVFEDVQQFLGQVLHLAVTCDRYTAVT